MNIYFFNPTGFFPQISPLAKLFIGFQDYITLVLTGSHIAKAKNQVNRKCI